MLKGKEECKHTDLIALDANNKICVDCGFILEDVVTRPRSKTLHFTLDNETNHE